LHGKEGDPVSRHQGWRAQAACASTDPGIFFPRTGESVQPAKAICARCPVTAQCLAHAVSVPEQHGVWGGLAERERHGLGPNKQPSQFRKVAA
jgi:WhiB family redox-sensing transcriptional regulator